MEFEESYEACHSTSAAFQLSSSTDLESDNTRSTINDEVNTLNTVSGRNMGYGECHSEALLSSENVLEKSSKSININGECSNDDENNSDINHEFAYNANPNNNLDMEKSQKTDFVDDRFPILTVRINDEPTDVINSQGVGDSIKNVFEKGVTIDEKSVADTIVNDPMENQRLETSCNLIRNSRPSSSSTQFHSPTKQSISRKKIENALNLAETVTSNISPIKDSIARNKIESALNYEIMVQNNLVRENGVFDASSSHNSIIESVFDNQVNVSGMSTANEAFVDYSIENSLVTGTNTSHFYHHNHSDSHLPNVELAHMTSDNNDGKFVCSDEVSDAKETYEETKNQNDVKLSPHHSNVELVHMTSDNDGKFVCSDEVSDAKETYEETKSQNDVKLSPHHSNVELAHMTSDNNDGKFVCSDEVSDAKETYEETKNQNDVKLSPHHSNVELVHMTSDNDGKFVCSDEVSDAKETYEETKSQNDVKLSPHHSNVELAHMTSDNNDGKFVCSDEVSDAKETYEETKNQNDVKLSPHHSNVELAHMTSDNNDGKFVCSDEVSDTKETYEETKHQNDVKLSPHHSNVELAHITSDNNDGKFVCSDEVSDTKETYEETKHQNDVKLSPHRSNVGLAHMTSDNNDGKFVCSDEVSDAKETYEETKNQNDVKLSPHRSFISVQQISPRVKFVSVEENINDGKFDDNENTEEKEANQINRFQDKSFSRVNFVTVEESENDTKDDVEVVEEIMSGRNLGQLNDVKSEVDINTGAETDYGDDSEADDLMSTFDSTDEMKAEDVQNTNEMKELLNESKYNKFVWPQVFQNELPKLKSSEESLQWVKEYKKVIVRNISWNLCARQPPPVDVLKLSPMFSFDENIFHLLLIGTEECERSIAASTLNTSKRFWESYLMSLLGPSYIPLRSHTLQAIHMICFVHESIAHLVSDVSSSAVATGVQNTLGNKGGVSIYLKILNTSFMFTNAHLAAGQKSVSRRNNNFNLISTTTPRKLFTKNRVRTFSVAASTSSSTDKKSSSNKHNDMIISRGSSPLKTDVKRSSSIHDSPLKSSSTSKSSSSKGLSFAEKNNENNEQSSIPLTLDESADRVIFMGDLNYRINGERKMILALIEKNMHEVLLNNDQLRKCMAQKLAFKNFIEAPLNFYPTYKYDIDSNNYDTGKKRRSPAWTDRILYVDRGMECLEYCSDDNIQSSDHRPVYATFLVNIQGVNSNIADINTEFGDTDRSLSDQFMKSSDFESPVFTQESQVCTIQ